MSVQRWRALLPSSCSWCASKYMQSADMPLICRWYAADMLSWWPARHTLKLSWFTAVALPKNPKSYSLEWIHHCHFSFKRQGVLTCTLFKMSVSWPWECWPCLDHASIISLTAGSPGSRKFTDFRNFRNFVMLCHASSTTSLLDLSWQVSDILRSSTTALDSDAKSRTAIITNYHCYHNISEHGDQCIN